MTCVRSCVSGRGKRGRIRCERRDERRCESTYVTERKRGVKPGSLRADFVEARARDDATAQT